MSDGRDQQIAQQQQEQNKRNEEIKRYRDADKALFDYYQKKLDAQKIFYEFPGVPLPLPKEEVGQPGVLTFEPGSMPPLDLLPYGIYPATIKDKSGLISSETDLQVNYSANGVRPNKDTPEAWRACIVFVVKNTLSDSVILNVHSDTSTPQDNMDKLKMWAEQCIELGVEAKLSGSSEEFLFEQKPFAIEKVGKWFGKEDAVSEIKTLVALSQVAVAEARLERAQAWIKEEKVKVRDQTNGDDKWNALNNKPIVADTPVEEITAVVDGMVKELEARMAKLENIQRRLDQVQAAEEKILREPENLVRVHDKKKGGTIKDNDKALERVSDNADVKRERTELIAEMKRGQEDIVVKKQALNDKALELKRDRPEAEKRDFSKGLEKLKINERLAGLDAKVGKTNDDAETSAFKTKLTAAKAWNDKTRVEKIAQVKPEEARPGLH